MPKSKEIKAEAPPISKQNMVDEGICDFEKIRLENIRQNKLILESLGLKPKIWELEENRVIYPPTNEHPDFVAFYQRPENFADIKIDKSQINKTLASRKSGPKIDDNSSLSEIRRSLRIQNMKKNVIDYSSQSYDALFLGSDASKRKRHQISSISHSAANSKLDSSTYVFQKPTEERENVYGAVEGVPVGQLFQSRMECCYSGIHRPPVGGIHGGPDGAYSVVLNGGYEDDVDFGETFTYTGEGGRDLKGTKADPKNLRSAPQSRDQELVRGNLALSKNVETRLPVRVVRGYKLNNRYAPMTGYRYDGLYTVEKCWIDRGLRGFNVYRFVFKRLPDQEPFPCA